MKTTLLLTANDHNDKLQTLARESKDIQFLLQNAVRRNYEVVLIPEATTSDIIQALNVPNREVGVLHYASHANSSTLRLNDIDADAKSLADKLRSLNTLKLVFLSGCTSKGQVQFFHEANIPLVIATSRPINDTKAFWVATQFYQYLSLGRSVRVAFEEVVKDAGLLQKDISWAKSRDIGRFSGEKHENVTFDWGLYTKDESDYTLPFALARTIHGNAVNHTIFLDNLIFTLEKVPHFKGIKQTANNIRRGALANGKKISELLKVLPYTLGVRIRQITAQPDEQSSEYYRELLYDYAFLYETLLHHTASILIAQIWQNVTNAMKRKENSYTSRR